MRKILQGVVSLFKKTAPSRGGKRRKTRGQSLVEVAIAFPMLIVLLTGVVEMGFILNFYLSLLDATRESARLYSGGDPYLANGTTSNDAAFYKEAALKVRKSLDPSYNPVTNSFTPGYQGRRIALDPTVDDVIISVYGISANKSRLCRDAGVYHLFPTAGSSSGNYQSIFTAASILNARVSGAPNAGVLVVEVHYNYHHVLGLPWMEVFLPNPLHLRAYTIMPNRAAEPPNRCPPP